MSYNSIVSLEPLNMIKNLTLLENCHISLQYRNIDIIIVIIKYVKLMHSDVFQKQKS